MNMESHGLAALGRDLQGVQQEAEQIAAAADAGSAQAGAHGFEQMLRRVDAQGHDAQARMQSVERGESDDLVGAMLSSQQANLSFQMLMQVRNKVMGAMDDLFKLQF
ncbi:flagellar hook-basal body complex protein FliE [Roseateles sp. BYS78W]|uniref:Flagellar hook-basal body complex protein FliE n=1 Tax=Pelomonas candidula TaxID=3299025 RepID=A0ABW7HGI0_9BURK